MSAVQADIAGSFREVAEWYQERSPLYRHLAVRIADDPEILSLAPREDSRYSSPLMLFAAVHYLILTGADRRLAQYYPSIAGEDARAIDESLYTVFKDFCLGHEEAIAEICRCRHPQANVVRRSAALFPGFLHATRPLQRPLAVIEVGASAGLNLLWDRYTYDYGRKGVCKRYGAPLKLSASLQGDISIGDRRPTVEWREGIDKHPLDVDDREDRYWLKANLKPDDVALHRKTARAIEAVRAADVSIQSGNALEVLPTAIRKVPTDLPLVLFDTQFRHYLSENEDEEYRTTIRTMSEERTIHWISGDGRAEGTRVWLRYATVENGDMERKPLATYSLDGKQIAWKAHT